MWKKFIAEQQSMEYFKELQQFVDNEYEHQTVYPKQSDVYNVFKTEVEDIKVVILGQDPYHNVGQANGLAFSSEKIPPSLRNIFKELNSDLGIEIPTTGDLSAWQNEGVFLLNTILTVREHSPLSHKGKGWEKFTDRVISHISDKSDGVVFMLWGANARDKKSLIDDRHLVIESVHPSPLSARRGFFGSKPFSRANKYLEEKGLKPINWVIKSIDLFNQI